MIIQCINQVSCRFVKIISRTREGVAQIEKILREKADVVCDKLNNIMGPVSYTQSTFHITLITMILMYQKSEWANNE